MAIICLAAITAVTTIAANATANAIEYAYIFSITSTHLTFTPTNQPYIPDQLLFKPIVVLYFSEMPFALTISM